ncbi:MAG TPA: 50S ribosomal protein L21 [Syntrophaceae bacterium]|nr:50S ribosomal protein L21 [Syntrophaceae bacterium]
MKYAIVQSGGKQYKVSEGDILKVEKIDGEKGDLVSINDVLMVVDDQNIRIGQPNISGAWVKGVIVGQGKAKKVIIFKSKRRKGYRKKQGHRQHYTALKIKEIKVT